MIDGFFQIAKGKLPSAVTLLVAYLTRFAAPMLADWPGYLIGIAVLVSMAGYALGTVWPKVRCAVADKVAWTFLGIVFVGIGAAYYAYFMSYPPKADAEAYYTILAGFSYFGLIHFGIGYSMSMLFRFFKPVKDRLGVDAEKA